VNKISVSRGTVKATLPALKDPQNSVNWKRTTRPITVCCFIIQQHPAQILRVLPLIIG